MAARTLCTNIHRHNWVTFLLGKFFLRSKERQVSYSLYAYLRQVDDFIDEGKAGRDEYLDYIQKQRIIVHELYSNGAAADDSLLSQIIEHDRMYGHKFKACIDLMMDVFEFDARRKNNGSVSALELHSYSMNLARAYTHFLIHFVEPRYQRSENDILLAHACHLAHMIRDLMIDHDLGYINIPREDASAYALDPVIFNTVEMSRWLKKEVRRIEHLMRQGKRALCSSPMFRVKLIGLLYCFRYEVIVRQIKTVGYSLRTSYPMCFMDMMRLCGQCFAVCVKHLFQCVRI
ncbi:squalene/phytoene synthase family protein [candidate division WOR-3 bacterium]|nr:squalene/phytoene synthase family protein [candidate division WOR-3 bacterium]